MIYCRLITVVPCPRCLERSSSASAKILRTRIQARDNARQSSVSDDRIAWNRKKMHSLATRHQWRPRTCHDVTVSLVRRMRARLFGALNTSKEKESSTKVHTTHGRLYTPVRIPRHVVNHASPNHLSLASVSAVDSYPIPCLLRKFFHDVHFELIDKQSKCTYSQIFEW